MRIGRVARCIAALLSAAAILAWRVPAARETQSEVSAEDYAVYNALLGLLQFPKKDPHVLICSRTLNMKCGEDSGNPILLNGCGGMRMPPDKPRDIGRMLREHWRELSITTWEDFAEKNEESAALRDAFSTSWKHFLVSERTDSKDSEAWDSPDDVLYFSRVGMNGDKSEAVLFVLNVSYMEEVATAGNYFLFRLKNTKWGPAGRITYVETK